MLYKFKSRTSAEVIMLQANGDQMLRIIGKDIGPQGIITLEQIPAALVAIEAAVVAAEATQQAKATGKATEEKDDDATNEDGIQLRQRAAPFIALLKESQDGDASVVWGV